MERENHRVIALARGVVAEIIYPAHGGGAICHGQGDLLGEKIYGSSRCSRITGPYDIGY